MVMLKEVVNRSRHPAYRASSFGSTGKMVCMVGWSEEQYVTEPVDIVMSRFSRSVVVVALPRSSE